MSISNVPSSTYVPPSTALGTNPGSSSAQGGGATEGVHHHGHRQGGGQIQDALRQALQSVGLAPSSASSATTSGNGTSATSATDSTASPREIGQDVRQFMAALVQAVKGDASSSTSSSASATAAGSGASDTKASFASGLAKVIAQVSSGNAPAGLQDAFNKLASALDPSGNSSSASTPTLQNLLTQFQQNLGYSSSGSGSSGSSNSAALGNLVSTQA